jgi:hypothetical protein
MINEDDLICQFAQVNSGHKRQISDTIFGINRLLDGDEWQTVAQIPHPYISTCNCMLSKVIDYLMNHGPYACPSCKKEPFHHNKRCERISDLFDAVNDCYHKTHGSFVCIFCKMILPVVTSTKHLAQCFDKYVEANKQQMTMADFCSVPGSGISRWQRIRFYACPFTTCVDRQMRADKFEPPNLYLKAIKTRRPPHKKYGLEGSDLRIWENHGAFALHVSTHLFVPEIDAAGQCTTQLRTATIGDDVVCGTYDCDQKFCNTPVGNAKRLIHLMRDHGLPILETEDGKAIDSREIDTRTLSEYMLQPSSSIRIQNNARQATNEQGQNILFL